MKNLGLQIYTCRDFMHTEEDVRETFRKVREAGYTMIQTAGCEIPYEKYGAFAREAGLQIIGTHDNFGLMVEDFDESLRLHKLLETDYMGVGGYSFKSIEDVEEFIEKANAVGKKCAANGKVFTYHNHNHEFYRWENGKTTMDMLVEGLDPETTSFVLDTYWVQAGGGDVVSWIEKLAGRIDIIHLKDMRITKPGFDRQQAITEIGAGNMDWDRIISACEKTGVKYYVVEQDNGYRYNCFDSIRRSAKYLEKYDI